MSLVLEIEFLTGVSRAAHGPSGDSPDWPPQPDRVFSALASAWGVRGELPAERTALEWLERQPPPMIRASGQNARTAPDVFVPPNDPKASTSMRTYLKVLPEHRPRQPRRFPVARPDDPNVELIWSRSSGCRRLRIVERARQLRGICRAFGQPDPLPVPDRGPRRVWTETDATTAPNLSGGGCGNLKRRTAPGLTAP